MSALILHQYELSPFSEKVRRILAFKQLAWSSVRAPAVMPKPDLVALTGGYRKIPVLQIGNHVYGDSSLIAQVLEQQQPEPTLYPTPLAQTFAEWADAALFEASLPLIMRPTRLDELLRVMTQHELTSMIDDRRAMRAGAPRGALPPKAALAHLQLYLARLDNTLARSIFLLGDAPCIADFSAYHSLWMAEQVNDAPFAKFEQVVAWLARIAALPAPAITPISSDDALRVSRESPTAWSPATPFADPLGLELEQQVHVRASDYGRDTIAGALVQSTGNEVVIRRDDPRAGTVYVHFPRVGYDITAA